MPWLVGIDEAGYGPNLGPFVTSAVACRVPAVDADLWQTLAAVLRRGGGRKRDARVVVDDSKVVYSGNKGLAGLERGVFSLFGLSPLTLRDLAERLCDGTHDLFAEPWFTGTSALPLAADAAELATLRVGFAAAGAAADVGPWHVRSVVVCPATFNYLAEKAGSKSAVLAYGFIRLLADLVAATAEGDVAVWVDKQGGRNTYASQIQQALPRGMVVVEEESNERSRYRVAGLGREVTLTFVPRADASWLCVAAASMVSKYLRELFMREFNDFWRTHVPGLEPTAGYPVDAVRFFEAIRPAVAALQMREETIWRRR